MRLGRRKNGDRVLWLVRFLKEWYAPKELIDRIRQHIECAKKGDLNPKCTYLMGEAFAQIVSDIELRDELLTETKNFLSNKDKLLKDEHPKEYLKMGEELETTVSEILKRVESVRKKYAE